MENKLVYRSRLYKPNNVFDGPEMYIWAIDTWNNYMKLQLKA